MQQVPISLEIEQVLEFTRQALSDLEECWIMEYDSGCEPRDEVRQAKVLLDLYWASTPEGQAWAAKAEDKETTHEA